MIGRFGNRQALKYGRHLFARVQHHFRIAKLRYDLLGTILFSLLRLKFKSL